jgi:hypothetical protein
MGQSGRAALWASSWRRVNCNGMPCFYRSAGRACASSAM